MIHDKAPNKQLISIRETAELTGMSPGWWRNAIAGNNPLPPIRIVRFGGSIRLHLADLLAYIEAGSDLPPKKRKRGRPKKTATTLQK